MGMLYALLLQFTHNIHPKGQITSKNTVITFRRPRVQAFGAYRQRKSTIINVILAKELHGA
jgi:hypothetical protein